MAEEKNIPGVATEKESDEVLEEIRTQTKEVLKELLAVAKMKPGQILVVGCSSSEIGSYKIGSHSSETIGQTVYKALYEELKPLGIYLAAQCCEHLNRSLILEEEAAEKYGYEPVNVVPQLKAGGSFSTAAYHTLEHPVAVEHIKAHAGIDIGAAGGANIVAADAGTVILSSFGYNGGYGNYVIISHGNGITTRYAHCSNLYVSVGQSVSKGQTIAAVGSTGASTGNHCHFEVRIDGESKNPLNYL